MTRSTYSRNLPEAEPESPEEILDGLAYLQQCKEQKCGFGVVLGSTRKARKRLIDQFACSIADRHVARVSQPTNSVRSFFHDLLLHLGLEHDEFSEPDIEDLLKLLSLFLDHEAKNGQPAVIIVEELQFFGPRVIDALLRLAQVQKKSKAIILICLTGDNIVNRILDSEGMSGVATMTRDRYDLDANGTRIMESIRQADPGAQESGLIANEREPVLDPRIEPVSEITVSLDGKTIGRFPIDQERMLIGRSKHNDVPIMSRFVSRHHALLINLPEGACLIDLKSSNGTTVNSVPIRYCTLNHGDIISIGNYRLFYENLAQSADAPIEPSDDDGFCDTIIMRSGLGIGLLAREANAAETQSEDALSAGVKKSPSH